MCYISKFRHKAKFVRSVSVNIFWYLVDRVKKLKWRVRSCWSPRWALSPVQWGKLEGRTCPRSSHRGHFQLWVHLWWQSCATAGLGTVLDLPLSGPKLDPWDEPPSSASPPSAPRALPGPCWAVSDWDHQLLTSILNPVILSARPLLPDDFLGPWLAFLPRAVKPHCAQCNSEKLFCQKKTPVLEFKAGNCFLRERYQSLRDMLQV